MLQQLPLATLLLLTSLIAFPTPHITAQESTTLQELTTWLTANTSWSEPNATFDSLQLPPITDRQLSQDEVASLRSKIWSLWVERNQKTFQEQITNKSLGEEPLQLKWLERRFGDSKEKTPLFISMHGGGGAPTSVNDQQWNNQIRLYEPDQGIVVAPRAPTNTWNLWHEGHIDGLFHQLILAYVATENVDPNRVYLMGYSAGGDGVYQLAPRMAYRFAAASMMAGHPNESRPLGLRNLPFSIFMGGKDGAYNRNQIAAEWGKQLDDLQTEDRDGYIHQLKIYPGKGHWMDREDREALPWMLQYRRTPYPKSVVWFQDDVTHRQFYWVRLPAAATPKGGDLTRIQTQNDIITIQSDVDYPLELMLDDQLLDLDAPITVTWNQQTVYQGPVKRSCRQLLDSFLTHHDIERTAPTIIPVQRQAQ